MINYTEYKKRRKLNTLLQQVISQ